jgi:hypothetical protein
MRAELFVELQMISLREQMQVDLTHDEAIGVRIADEGHRALPARELDPIIEAAIHAGQRRLEKTFGPKAVGREALLFGARKDDAHFLRVRSKDANDEVVADSVRPEDAERIGVSAREENI